MSYPEGLQDFCSETVQRCCAAVKYHQQAGGKGAAAPQKNTHGSVCGGFSRGTPLERGSNVAPLPGFFCQAFFHLEKKRSEGDVDVAGDAGGRSHDLQTDAVPVIAFPGP